MAKRDFTKIRLLLSEAIISKFPGLKKKEIIAILSKMLGTTETAIYNKLSDRSSFAVEEVCVICDELGISVDELLREANENHTFIPFYSDGLKYSPRSFPEYLRKISSYFSVVKKMENAEGYFIANELPLFHFLDFPFLMYLKFYIWNDINWRIEGLNKFYDPGMVTLHPEFIAESNLLKDYFRSFDTTEIWNANILDNTIIQFKYLVDKGIISRSDDKANIIRELNNLVDYLERMVDTGKKPANIKDVQRTGHVYFTELMLGPELILVKTDTGTMLFQQLDTPNYMRSTSKRLTDKIWQQFVTIRKRTTDITDAGEVVKHKLFVSFRAKIDSMAGM
jgi:hypothetical protein